MSTYTLEELVLLPWKYKIDNIRYEEDANDDGDIEEAYLTGTITATALGLEIQSQFYINGDALHGGEIDWHEMTHSLSSNFEVVNDDLSKIDRVKLSGLMSYWVDDQLEFRSRILKSFREVRDHD